MRDCKVCPLVLLNNILKSSEYFEILYSLLNFEVFYLPHHKKAIPWRWQISQPFPVPHWKQKVRQENTTERLAFQEVSF